MLDENLDCRGCDEILQKERGCETDGKIPFYINNEKYFRCPLRLVTDVSWEYISAYNHYQKGILPNGNGFNNESKKFLDAMSIIEKELNKDKPESKNG